MLTKQSVRLPDFILCVNLQIYDMSWMILWKNVNENCLSARQSVSMNMSMTRIDMRCCVQYNSKKYIHKTIMNQH